jgi:hypothetical protein
MFFFYILGSLSIHPVELADDGDYVCIASNVLGRSFSSIRSLIVSGKNDRGKKPDRRYCMIMLVFFLHGFIY